MHFARCTFPPVGYQISMYLRRRIKCVFRGFHASFSSSSPVWENWHRRTQHRFRIIIMSSVKLVWASWQAWHPSPFHLTCFKPPSRLPSFGPNGFVYVISPRREGTLSIRSQFMDARTFICLWFIWRLLLSRFQPEWRDTKTPSHVISFEIHKFT